MSPPKSPQTPKGKKPATKKRPCECTTLSGAPCKNASKEGSRFCVLHQACGVRWTRSPEHPEHSEYIERPDAPSPVAALSRRSLSGASTQSPEAPPARDFNVAIANARAFHNPMPLAPTLASTLAPPPFKTRIRPLARLGDACSTERAERDAARTDLQALRDISRAEVSALQAARASDTAQLAQTRQELQACLTRPPQAQNAQTGIGQDNAQATSHKIAQNAKNAAVVPAWKPFALEARISFPFSSVSSVSSAFVASSVSSSRKQPPNSNTDTNTRTNTNTASAVVTVPALRSVQTARLTQFAEALQQALQAVPAFEGVSFHVADDNPSFLVATPPPGSVLGVWSVPAGFLAKQLSNAQAGPVRAAQPALRALDCILSRTDGGACDDMLTSMSEDDVENLLGAASGSLPKKDADFVRVFKLFGTSRKASAEKIETYNTYAAGVTEGNAFRKKRGFPELPEPSFLDFAIEERRAGALRSGLPDPVPKTSRYYKPPPAPVDVRGPAAKRAEERAKERAGSARNGTATEPIPKALPQVQQRLLEKQAAWLREQQQEEKEREKAKEKAKKQERALGALGTVKGPGKLALELGLGARLGGPQTQTTNKVSLSDNEAVYALLKRLRLQMKGLGGPGNTIDFETAKARFKAAVDAAAETTNATESTGNKDRINALLALLTSDEFPSDAEDMMASLGSRPGLTAGRSRSRSKFSKKNALKNAPLKTKPYRMR